MTRAILQVDGLQLKVAGNLLFSDLSFEIPPTGIVGLMGPVGTGKSSLVKWICGAAEPGLQTSTVRRAEYFYNRLGMSDRPRMLGQKAASSFEETMIMLNALLRTNPAMICVDEITAQLDPRESAHVLHRLSVIGQARAVLMVSHNQTEVEAHCSSVMMLAGGYLQEHTPSSEFFSSPHSDAGRQFVRTGSVAMPRIGTPARHLRSDLRAVSDGIALEPSKASTGITSVVRDRLFVVSETLSDGDLGRMSQKFDALGITTIVLVDNLRPPAAEDRPQSIFSMVDLHLPAAPTTSVSQYKRRAAQIKAMLDNGERVLIVDRRNITGAVRAAALELVFVGLSADKAASFAQALLGQNMTMADEQLLWDLELAMDLDADRAGPSDSVGETLDRSDFGLVSGTDAQQLRQGGADAAPRRH